MRRSAVGMMAGFAVGALAWGLLGPRTEEGPPVVGDGTADGAAGRATRPEEEGGGGGRALLEEAAVPAESTRLAAGGLRSPAPSLRGESAAFAGTDIFLAPTNGGDHGPPPELVEAAEGVVEGTLLAAVERHLTPWEERRFEQRGLYAVPVRRGDPVAAGVTERAYAVFPALARLAFDPPEVGRVRSWTPVGTERDARRLGDDVYARTGEPLWRTTGTWIGWGARDSGRSEAPLLVRQTAEGHAAVEAALDALLAVGGDARTIRVWRGELGPGSLDVGEARRLDASIPWRAAAEGPALAAPLELDVPVDRVVTAFLGDVHAFVADYDVEISQAANAAMPLYDLAHDGLSVRARVLPATEEVEIQWIEVREAPPFPTFSTSLASGPESASAPVVIELPEGPSKRAVARLPAREGEAWIVGLGGTRAALVEILRSVQGAGPRRCGGWDRAPSQGVSGVPADPALAHAEQREGAHPPAGAIHAELVRPSRTEGASPWGYRVDLETDGAGVLTPFGALDRTREEALPFGGGVFGDDRALVLQGGTCVRARWVGGTSVGEAYDVVLSVSEPSGTRDGPPIVGADPRIPVRLSSFRRALVPVRIVVPHGGVGRRTVTLDLGRGPEPWTVSLSGGARAE